MIPFIALPPPSYLTNNRSVLNNAESVVKAVNELLLNRCVIKVFSRPCCNPLSVVVGRKVRLVDPLILSLRTLRASLCKILISSFAHKMDFAHNFSVDFF